MATNNLYNDRMDYRARHLTIIVGSVGALICQQKLPAGPGI